MRRILLYAQTPPPLHGQSVMAELLMESLRASGQIDLVASEAEAISAPMGYVHINPQVSDDLGDIGRWRPGKIFRVFGHVFAALRARFRYQLDTFYFIPAPPKREAIYRDWVVLLLCRPFFRRLVLHWHCIGQPEFLEQKLSAPERWITRLLYGNAAVSIALSRYSEKEASYFSPVQSTIVPNGIVDPCPQFDAKLWPDRQRRVALRQVEPAKEVFCEVLFLAGRMEPKGLFDAMAAVQLANEQLMQQRDKLRLRLTVAGPFENDGERRRYDSAASGINEASTQPLCVYAGWADESKKRQLYCAADIFLFPTTYPAESFGLVLAEAMAHGCAIVTTRWQAVPETLPPGDPNVVEPHDIAELAAALLRCAKAPADRSLRDYFLAHFTRERFARDMIRVLGDG